MDKENCVRKAVIHFEEAFKGFKVHHHLKGMYLSKKNSLNQMREVDSFAEQKKKTQKEVDNLRAEYMKYWKEVGLDNSCYIPREHGDEISLLTELVLDAKVEDIFPK